RNLGRKGETVTVKFLEDMTINDADMRTIILIGSSKTRLIEQGKTKQWVYTPRHY
ncbi:MAG: precorrin-3B C(17)-methyltransferase, partial [Microcystis aeruginosa BS13-02]|nr:precorrin-3B C(17)-methyltransferase [Microcystis aeruginosa BS13-02]